MFKVFSKTLFCFINSFINHAGTFVFNIVDHRRKIIFSFFIDRGGVLILRFVVEHGGENVSRSVLWDVCERLDKVVSRVVLRTVKQWFAWLTIICRFACRVGQGLDRQT